MPKLALIMLLAVISTSLGATPQRVVSLNLCTDQLLLMLVPAQRVRMLSQLADNPAFSYQHTAAAGLPLFDGTVESVIRQQPDLVLAGHFAAASAVALLRRLGYPVKIFAMPESIAGTRAFISAVARSLDEVPAGEALIARLDRELASLRQTPDDTAPLTLIYLPNGLTSGDGTLKHELIRYAGLRNLSDVAGVRGYGSIGLESVLRAGPQLILFDEAELGAPSMARALLVHPALRALRVPVVAIPTSTWICPGPMITQALKALAKARRIAIESEN